MLPVSSSVIFFRPFSLHEEAARTMQYDKVNKIDASNFALFVSPEAPQT